MTATCTVLIYTDKKIMVYSFYSLKLAYVLILQYA